MPLPRFEKLPQEKQDRILEAAAKVFAAFGYEKASLNLMLAGAGISKGAAYYYFADKADLVGTVVRRYWVDPMALRGTAFADLTAEDFWHVVSDLFLSPYHDAEQKPWLLGLSRAVWELPRDERRSEPLRSIAEEAADWLAALLRRVRELELVRTDLPDDLLVELIKCLDGVHDRWLGSKWQEMDSADRDRTTATFVSFLKKMLAPPTSGEETL